MSDDSEIEFIPREKISKPGKTKENVEIAPLSDPVTQNHLIFPPIIKKGLRPKPKPKLAPSISLDAAASSRPLQPNSYNDDLDLFMRTASFTFTKGGAKVPVHIPSIMSSSQGRPSDLRPGHATSPMASKGKAKVIDLDSDSDISSSPGEYSGQEGSARKKKSKKRKPAPGRKRDSASRSPSRKKQRSNEDDSDEDVLDPSNKTKEKNSQAMKEFKKEQKAAAAAALANSQAVASSPRLRDRQARSTAASGQSPSPAGQQEAGSSQNGALPEFADQQDVDWDPAMLEIFKNRDRSASRALSPRADDGAARLDEGLPVKITVKMVASATPAIHEAMAEQVRIHIAAWEAPLVFDMRSRQSFARLVDHIALSKHMSASDVVLEHNHGQVYQSLTPENLRITTFATMTGYHRNVYEEIRKQRAARKAAAFDRPIPASQRPVEQAEKRQQPSSAATEDDADEVAPGNIKVTLTSKNLANLPVEVPASLKVRALVKHFLKHYDMMNKLAATRIELDGDEIPLNDRIDTTEIESDVQLDIVFS